MLCNVTRFCAQNTVELCALSAGTYCRPLPQDPENLFDAIAQLLERIEDTLQCTTQEASGYAAPAPPLAVEAASPTRPCKCSPSNAGRLSGGGTTGEDVDRVDALLLNLSRVMESLLRMVEEWILTGYPGVSGMRGGGVGCRSSSHGNVPGEPGILLAELVFGSYERILLDQHNLTARSDSFGSGIAFASCVGVAIDSILAVLDDKAVSTRWTLNGGSFGVARDVCSHSNRRSSRLATVPRDRDVGGRDQYGRRRSDGVGIGRGYSEEGRMVEGMEVNAADDHGPDSSPAPDAATLCLDTILTTVVAFDLVVWLLDLYKRCGINFDANDDEDTDTRVAMSGVVVALPPKQPVPVESDDGIGPGTRAKKLLAEVLQSLLYAQGWVNGLCSPDTDCPVHTRGTTTNSVTDGFGGDGRGGDTGRENSNEMELSPGLAETVKRVLPTWHSQHHQQSVPFDHHVISLLGTGEDNGGLCKLVVSAKVEILQKVRGSCDNFRFRANASTNGANQGTQMSSTRFCCFRRLLEEIAAVEIYQ